MKLIWEWFLDIHRQYLKVNGITSEPTVNFHTGKYHGCRFSVQIASSPRWVSTPVLSSAEQRLFSFSAGNPSVCCALSCRFTWSAMLEPAPLSPRPGPPQSSSAPALTPRAAYGKVIRAQRPFEEGDRKKHNSSEHDAVSPFSTSPTFFFPLFEKNSYKTLYYSLLFQFISLQLAAQSGPPSLCLSLVPLNPNLPLDSALIFCLSTFLMHLSSQVTQRSCLLEPFQMTQWTSEWFYSQFISYNGFLDLKLEKKKSIHKLWLPRKSFLDLYLTFKPLCPDTTSLGSQI